MYGTTRQVVCLAERFGPDLLEPSGERTEAIRIGHHYVDQSLGLAMSSMQKRRHEPRRILAKDRRTAPIIDTRSAREKSRHIDPGDRSRKKPDRRQHGEPAPHVGWDGKAGYALCIRDGEVLLADNDVVVVVVVI